MTDDTDKEAPEGILLSAEDLDGITQEEIDELKPIIEDYTEAIEQFEEDLDDVLSRINESTVYEKLGVELHIDVEYLYSVAERNNKLG
jgi:predicted RecB family endonuclease